MRGPWRLKKLVELARELQRSRGTSGDSKRVRWNPTERLVRYYTTLGLVDGPAEMRGRTAYYGPKHLLQLIGIKTLQARGLSLEQIQPQLAGLPVEYLCRLSGLDENWLESLEAEVGTGPSPEAREAQPFWAQLPAPSSWKIEPPKPAGFHLQGIELAPGVTLMIDSQTYPDADPDQIRRAAQPLLDSIQRED